MFKMLRLAGALAATAVLANLSAAEAPDKTDDKSPEHAAEKPADKTGGEADKDKSKGGEPKEKVVESRHTVTIHGQKIEYTAKAGTILLRDHEDKPTAGIFDTASHQNGAGE